VEEALALAVRLHRDGQFAEAETVYRRILAVCPEHPDTLHFLGVLAHQQKKSTEAIDLIGRAIALVPDQPDFRNNLGNVFKEQGLLAEAADAYRQVIALQPGYGAAHNNLGTVLKEQGHLEDALVSFQKALAIQPNHVGALLNLGGVLAMLDRLNEATVAYQKVISLNPDHAEAYYRLGHIYWDQGRYEDAVAVFRKTTDLEPNHGDAYFVLGSLFYQHKRFEDAVAAYRKCLEVDPGKSAAYRMLGVTLNLLDRTDEAVVVWEQWLKQEPENPIPRHMLAAATGRNVPARASDAFVQKTFDAFAGTFDAQLEHLEYRAPELVAKAIAGRIGTPAADLEVLDAGCGTGLCGPLLRPYARVLTGIDLSAEMLEKARQRGGYDRLAKAELTEFMDSAECAYDLIASADTLVYFGDLNPPFQSAAKALRPGGHLVFTLEKASDTCGEAGFVLHALGRYCHTEDYVKTRLQETGFAVCEISSVVLRKEAGKPVQGMLVAARRG
jgi:predicted TPR repeat methyltransferase